MFSQKSMRSIDMPSLRLIASGLVFASVALAALSPAASAHEETKNGVTVAHPWVRATPGGAKLSSAYLEIKTADKADRLIGAKAEGIDRVEIHTHEMDGDVMRMRRVDGIDLPASSSKVLKPSGDHIMLLDLKSPLEEGELVKMTLSFEKAGDITVEATVEPVGAMGPHGMDHQPGHDGDASGGGGHEHMHH